MLKTTLCLLIICVAVQCADDDKYTSKYDHIDVDEILHSERLLQNYCKCLLDQGPCTPDAGELKRVLREALQTDCAKCNDKQREMSMKVAQYLFEHKQDVWKPLEAKYDPNGEYRAKYADRLTTPKP